jgi:cell division protein FtsB
MKTDFRTKAITVGLVGVSVWLAFLVAGSQIRYLSGQRQLDAMDDRIDGAERENGRLARELELMKQPDWLALLARARLNYKRPGETVVFVYKAEKSGTIIQPQTHPERPNWQKWLDWARGK